MTYKEATEFREAANVPLVWKDNDLPAPFPIDRIEFTRRIVEGVQSFVEGTVAWNAPLRRRKNDTERTTGKPKFEVHLFSGLRPFDFSIRDYEGYRINLPDPSESDPPSENTREHPEEPADIVDPIEEILGNLIEELETKYFGLWLAACRYGLAEEAKYNVLEVICTTLRQYSGDKTQQLEENTTLSQFYHPFFISNLFDFYEKIQSLPSNNLSLTDTYETLFFNIPSCLSPLIVIVLMALLIALYVYLFNVNGGLVLFAPFAFIVAYITCSLFLTSQSKWKHPQATLGEVADEVVSLHQALYLRMLEETLTQSEEQS
jgi:hypothetical protein